MPVKKKDPAATATTTAPAPVAAPSGLILGAPAGVVTAPRFRLATSDPDEMIATGLADKFWGTCVFSRLRVVLYEKGKKAGCYYLSATLGIQADDPELGDKGIVSARMRVADLNHWAPSMDGMTLAGGGTAEDFILMGTGKRKLPPEFDLSLLDGIYAAGIGTQDGVPNNTAWAQFITACLDAKLPRERVRTSRYDWVEGVRAFWCRVPYQSKGGALTLEEGQRAPEVMVPTEIDLARTMPAPTGVPGASIGMPVSTFVPAAQTIATPNPAPAPAAPAVQPAISVSGSTLETLVDSLILAAVNAAPGNSIHRTGVGQAVANGVAAAGRIAEMSAALGYLNDTAWLGGDARSFAFEPDTGNITTL